MTLGDSGFSLSRYKAVIFDLDSTITNSHGYPLKASLWLLSKITDNVETIADEYLHHLIMNYRKGIKEIVDGAEYRTPYDVIKRAIQESLQKMNLDIDPGLLEEGTRLFRWLHVENSTVYTGVRDLLQKLQGNGTKLGIVTNAFEKHHHLILSKLDILDYFQCLVDSGDVLAFKPSPQPFRLALSCLGVTPQETLFVGDEYFADIVGATLLGMDAIWVNNRGGNLEKMISKYGEPSRPLMVVESISELSPYL